MHKHTNTGKQRLNPGGLAVNTDTDVNMGFLKRQRHFYVLLLVLHGVIFGFSFLSVHSKTSINQLRCCSYYAQVWTCHLNPSLNIHSCFAHLSFLHNMQSLYFAISDCFENSPKPWTDMSHTSTFDSQACSLAY